MTATTRKPGLRYGARVETGSFGDILHLESFILSNGD